MMEKKRVEYFGNVRVGKDVSLDELRGLYHAVVLAYGAGGGSVYLWRGVVWRMSCRLEIS